MSTIDDFKKALGSPNASIADDVAKAFSQSATATSGLTYYDLEAPAKTLYPVLTPLRNKIPRVVGGRGIQANWRAVTGINSGGVFPGIAEGKRNASIDHTTADYLAAFRGMGFDDYVTFESEYAANGFDDVKARAVEGLLRSLMIWEEFADLGGNTSVALGTTPTPTLADITTGGSIAQTTTYKVYCVALTMAGYQQLAGWNNGVTGQALDLSTAVLSSTFSRTNADGTSDTVSGGTAQKSSVASVTTATDGLSTHSISATVTPVAGAVAYAWYWGTVGAEYLGAVTTINSVLITAAATGTQLVTGLFTADKSTDALVYDGMLSQIAKSGSGSYIKHLATGTAGTGTKLTSDGGGGISEINTAFQGFWNSYRMSPSEIFVNAQQLTDITALVIAGGSAPLYRFQIDGNNPGSVSAGTVVSSILNPITNTMVKVTVHPNMPAGTIMFWSDTVPFPVSNTGQLVRKLLRRDYYQIEFPLRTRKYEYGVYMDGVLQNYFPPAFGLINNIAAGH